MDGNTVSEWLAGPHPPSALLAAWEDVGMEVTQTVVRSGRRLGVDLEVMILGDTTFSFLYKPGTHWLAWSRARLGTQAAAEVLREIEGRPPAGRLRLIPSVKWFPQRWPTEPLGER